jgi:16S rRNA (guanine527-N7)-methyltransferase
MASALSLFLIGIFSMTLNLAVLAAELFQVSLDSLAVQRFGLFQRELLAWNQKINLTSITEPDAILVKHFLDSLSIFSLAGLPESGRVMDIGTGAGLPGLALKIARPAWNVTLSDATAKKITVLHDIIAKLGLEGVQAIQGRAEDLGQHPHQRGQYALVTARAVARLPILLEYMLPLAQQGGLCIAMKGESAAQEVEDSANALAVLGGHVESLTAIQLPTLEQTHYLIAVRKVAKTPSIFPRRAGLPSKSPL